MSPSHASNILTFAENYPNATIILWTSRPVLFFLSIGIRDRRLNKAQNNNPLDRIQIQNPRDLFRGMVRAAKKGDSRHKLTSREIHQLSAIHARELNGAYKNYAAASDVFRLVVLYALGGVYMDTDVRTKLVNGRPPNIDMPTLTDKDGKPRSIGFGVKMHPNQQKWISNAFLVAEAGADFIYDLLRKIINIYSYPISNSVQPSLDTWREKRSGYLVDSDVYNYLCRFHGTMLCSGPALIRDELMHAVNQIKNTRVVYSPNDINSLFFDSLCKGVGQVNPRFPREESIWAPGFDAGATWTNRNAPRVRRVSVDAKDMRSNVTETAVEASTPQPPGSSILKWLAGCCILCQKPKRMEKYAKYVF